MSGWRRTVAIALAAVAGLVVAAALTTAASSLSGQNVGLSSEPLTAGRGLAPERTPRATPVPERTPRPHRTARPRPTRTALPAPTRTAVPVPTRTAIPTRKPAPTTTPRDDHGGDDHGGDDHGGGHGDDD